LRYGTTYAERDRTPLLIPLVDVEVIMCVPSAAAVNWTTTGMTAFISHPAGWSGFGSDVAVDRAAQRGRELRDAT
jgi:hypothetical protein